MCDFTTINPLIPTAKFHIPKHLKLHWCLHLFTTVGLPPVAFLTSNSCYCVILNNSKRTQNVFEINYKNVIHKITHKKKTETSSHLLQHPSRFITSRLGSRVILFWRIYRELRNVWQTHLPTICDANNIHIHTHTHRFTSSLQLGDPRCTLLEKLCMELSDESGQWGSLIGCRTSNILPKCVGMDGIPLAWATGVRWTLESLFTHYLAGQLYIYIYNMEQRD